MLLGALVDLGVPVAALQEAVDAVLPGAVSLTAIPVRRAGLRATHVDVAAADDGASRTWADVRVLIERADLDRRVRDLALGVFERLAGAGGRGGGGPARQGDLPQGGAPHPLPPRVRGGARGTAPGARPGRVPPPPPRAGGGPAG